MPRIDVKKIERDNYYYFNNCINYVAKEGHCIKGFIGGTHWYLSENRNKHVPTLVRRIQDVREFYGKQDMRL